MGAKSLKLNKMYPRLENKFLFNEVHKICLDDLDADETNYE